MEVDDSIVLIVGDPRWILGLQLRPRRIHLICNNIMLIIYYIIIIKLECVIKQMPPSKADTEVKNIFLGSCFENLIN